MAQLNWQRTLRAALLAAAATSLAACGGGSSSGSSADGSGGSDDTGGGGDVSGVEMPASLSVVTAQDTTSTSAAGKAVVMDTSTLPSDSEYHGDRQRAHVWDPSIEPLSIVNEILCSVDQLAADEMVNEGAYIALVNEAKCQQGSNQSGAQSSGQNSGSSSNAVEYESWVVRSTRTSNSEPQTVQVWIPGAESTSPDEGPGDGPILVEIEVSEGVSNTNPFGRFKLNFKGVQEDEFGNTFTTMTGMLKTVDNDSTKPQFTFINETSSQAETMGFSFNQKSNVLLDNADGDSGMARTSFSESFTDSDGNTMSDSAEFAIGFDSTRFLRSETTQSQSACAARDDFNEQVWQYNLYHVADGTFNGRDVSAGERVRLVSGFPFTYTTGTGATVHGHVGYWGLWMEDESIDLDGRTITRADGTQYTVDTAPGRMNRRVRNQLALSELNGEEFYYWGQSPESNQYPDEAGYTDWVVTYDGTDFAVVAGVTWGEEGPDRTELSSTETFTLSDGQRLDLWSDSLGGNIVYVEDSTVTNPSVTFYAHESVMPGDSALAGQADGQNRVTLWCYEGCVKGGITQSDVDLLKNSGDESGLFYQYWDDQGAVQGPFEYAFDLDDMTLYDMQPSTPTVVDLVDGGGELDMSGTWYEWGIGTSEMVTSQLTNDQEPWRVYEQDTTYRWETGFDSWSRLTTVTAQGESDPVAFDKPLQFTYTHSTANDRNGNANYDGKTMLLEYGGRGQLWGFPWVQDGNRWYSAVNLADGTILDQDGDSGTTGDRFVVKATDMEQKMRVFNDTSECSLSLPDESGLPLPTSDQIEQVSLTLSEKPVVDTAPAVIEGEVQ